jgi:hypothetical protein
VVTLAFFNAFTLFFLLTQYLQFVKGYSPLKAGLGVLPNAMAMITVAPRGPQIIARFGVRRTLRVGFFVAATGFVAFAFFTPSTPYFAIACALVANGCGMAVIVPSASQQIVAALPLSKAGVGSAVNDVTREVGGALGIAIGGSIVATVYRSRMGDFLDAPHHPIPEPVRSLVQDSIGGAFRAAANAPKVGSNPSLIEATLDAARHAFTSGMHWAFGVTALTGYVAGWLLPRHLDDELPTRAH